MNKKAFLYIILAGVLWGTSGIFVHALSPYGLSSAQITCIRGVVSTLCMMIYTALRHKKSFTATPKQLFGYLMNGIAIFSTSTSYFISMQTSSVSTAVVLMYTAPIFCMIYSVLFLNEKFTKTKFISLIFVIVGCGLVSGIIGGMKYSTYGIAFGFLAGISYSAYNIITKILMQKKYDAISTTMYTFLFMTLVSFVIENPYEIISVAKTYPKIIPVMILCGILTCVLPYFFYTLALKYFPVGVASSLGIIEPMAATIFGVLLLSEPLDIFSVIGIILILSAVFMLGREQE